MCVCVCLCECVSACMCVGVCVCVCERARALPRVFVSVHLKAMDLFVDHVLTAPLIAMEGSFPPCETAVLA